MPDRYEGPVEIGSLWELRNADRVIRIVGPEDVLHGGWLFEFVRAIGGSPIPPGGKRERVADDVLRTIYKPIEEDEMSQTRLQKAIFDLETEVDRVDHDAAKRGVSIEERKKFTAPAREATGSLRELAKDRPEVQSS